MLHALELGGDFGAGLGQAFAGANVERHICPAPVLNEQLQRYVGFRRRVGRNAFFLFIAWSRLSVNYAGGVLRARDVGCNLLWSERWDGAHNFDLLVANGIGIEGHRRLHSREAEHLHDMVLHHVAYRSRLFVILGACANTQAFGDVDLHMIDVLLVPEWLEDTI